MFPVQMPAAGYQRILIPDGTGAVDVAMVPIPHPVYRERPGMPVVLPARAPVLWRQYAAISFVNASTQNGNSVTTITLAKPTNTADGDFLLMHLIFFNGTAGVACTGWTAFASTGGASTAGEWALAKIAASEGASWAPTWTGAQRVMGSVTAWRGVDTTWQHSLMAWDCRNVNGTNGPTRQLLFQSCSYMIVSGIRRTSSAGGLTRPSGWSSATNQSNGTLSLWEQTAYLSVSNTQGAAATTWTSTAGATQDVLTVALRGAGVTALSMKCYSMDSTRTSGTTCSPPLPASVTDGDLIVVHAGGFVGTSGSDIAMSCSGYTQKGTLQSRNTSNYRLSGAVFYRIATGSGDAPTVSVGTSEGLSASVVIYGTGSLGLDASLPGTMGQATDNTSDLVRDIPAMTLPDYAENNIVTAFLVSGESVQPAMTVPSGFYDPGNRGATFQSGLSIYDAMKMNSGADPGATTYTCNTTAFSLGFQYAVGVEFEGQGATVGQAIWLG